MREFDYQIGGDYEPPAGVTRRVAGTGSPASRSTVPTATRSATSTPSRPSPTRRTSTARTSDRTGRPSSCWSELGDDPNWGGEYLVDLSTATRQRAAAVDHVAPMIDTVRDKGFAAVELDNLDSWTSTSRCRSVRTRPSPTPSCSPTTPTRPASPSAQKNTPELGAETLAGRDRVRLRHRRGVRGRTTSAPDYTDVFGANVIDHRVHRRGLRRRLRSRRRRRCQWSSATSDVYDARLDAYVYDTC